MVETMKRRTKYQDIRIAVVNDLHVGSKYAIVPDNWKMIDGESTAPQNAGARYLWQKYQEYIEEFKKPDILVVNGDAVDAQQHLSHKREVWATDPLDQIALAEHLINMWEAKEIYVVYGTGFHVELEGLMLERILAKRISARGVGWKLRQTFNTAICSFAHHVPVSKVSWQYRTTPLAQQLVLDKLENEDQPANLLVRSHAHYFAYAGFSNQLAVITPGFQGQTPYGAKVSPEIKPKIGIVCVDVPSLTMNYRTADGPMLKMEKP